MEGWVASLFSWFYNIVSFFSFSSWMTARNATELIRTLPAERRCQTHSPGAWSISVNMTFCGKATRQGSLYQNAFDAPTGQFSEFRAGLSQVNARKKRRYQTYGQSATAKPASISYLRLENWNNNGRDAGRIDLILLGRACHLVLEYLFQGVELLVAGEAHVHRLSLHGPLQYTRTKLWYNQ